MLHGNQKRIYGIKKLLVVTMHIVMWHRYYWNNILALEPKRCNYLSWRPPHRIMFMCFKFISYFVVKFYYYYEIYIIPQQMHFKNIFMPLKSSTLLLRNPRKFCRIEVNVNIFIPWRCGNVNCKFLMFLTFSVLCALI